MAMSPNGNFLVSGSHDRSIRLWEKTDEILVLSEEREIVSLFDCLFNCLLAAGSIRGPPAKPLWL